MKATCAPFSFRKALAVAGITCLFLPQVHAQLVQSFFAAIQRNDTNSAMQMLDNNTNLVYARDNFSKLPLLEAAAVGNASLVKRMLELGADVNVEGDTMMSGGSRMTALDEAAQFGRLEVCKLLLEAGANPNHRAFQDTTLHFAFNNLVFSTNRNAVATILLEYGANPFAEAGYYKTTPLELAITRSDGRLAPLMLDTDGKIKSAANSRLFPPNRNQAATTKGQAAQFLAAHGAAILAAAVQRGELEAVQALLKAGVSAKTNAPDELPVLQVFAIAEAPAVKSYPDALAQWQQTSNDLKRLGTNANQSNLDFTRSRAIEQSARVEVTNPERWLKIRDLLIKNGADYDAFAATALADTNRTIRLLAMDENVGQARDRDGQTPLHWAVLNDQLPLTSFWLQSGASPAATNFAGQTPLHIAATKGLTEQVKLLLAANASADIRDTNGWTPLDAAIQAKQSDSIHLLMAKAPAAAHPERGLTTSLHEAASSGNVGALAGLLDTETNLEARNELALTPLQVAVLHGHLASAALLVDKGADVNVRDPGGNTLLHQILLQDQLTIYDRPPTNWLARVGQDPSKQLYVKYLTVGQYEQGPNPLLQAASLLLASGANATATNNAGETATGLITDEKLGRGVFFFDNDRTELVQLLGAHGADVNQRDADGDTALHRLVRGFWTIEAQASVYALVQAGADVNAKNNRGRTPLQETMTDGRINIEWLETLLNQREVYLDWTNVLLNVHPDPNVQDNEGQTALHLLARADASSRKEATRALLDTGANPNLRDKQGRTPAHLFLSGKFAWSEAGECIDMLVAAGADLSAKDDQGRTPLHCLAALGSESPMFFIRGIGDTFTQAKVDINARDNNGDTPLQLAAKTGTKDVYDWLAKQGASQDARNNAGETPRQQALRSTNVFSGFRFNPDTDIYQAIRDGKLESVAEILKSEPNLLNQSNQLYRVTPLRWAIQTHRTNIVEFLDKQGAQWDPASAVLAGRTDLLRNLISQQSGLAADGSLLRVAAANGNVPATKILLAAGSDLKATDPFGRSPLGIAVSQQHGDVAELLTKQGAAENMIDAAFTDDAETAAALINRDKSVASATNAMGVSPAEIAAAMGKGQILKLLLDKGVSPNFQNPSTGKSLLDVTAEFDQTNTAELLIQRRARLDVADKFGFLPIHIAALQGSGAVLELLLNHKADRRLRTGGPDMPRPLAGAMPRVVDWRLIASQKNTPLHLAALTCQTNSIALLLKWGAPVNDTNTDGMTPLDLASQIGQPPFMLIDTFDRRFPISPSPNPAGNYISRRNAAVALLEQSGGKHGEGRGPAGMMPFGSPTMTRYSSMPGAPGPQAPVLQTGADYHVQGCFLYNSHRFTNALADFRKSCELGSDNQDYSYFRIWLIRTRLGEKEAATQELTAYLERRKTQKPDDWPSKVGRFLAGKLSESDLLKAADDSNPQTAKEQHCEAYFYLGSIHLIENDKMAAVDYFKKCLTTNVTDFEEYRSAEVELQFLEMPSTNH